MIAPRPVQVSPCPSICHSFSLLSVYFGSFLLVRVPVKKICIYDAAVAVVFFHWFSPRRFLPPLPPLYYFSPSPLLTCNELSHIGSLEFEYKP